MLTRLAGLHGLHRQGPIQTTLGFGEQVETGATIAGFKGAQIGEEAAALGPAEPEPGLSTLLGQGRPRCRRRRWPIGRIGLSPGPAAGQSGTAGDGTGSEAEGQHT